MRCTLPSLPAGEIEAMVVDQLRSVFLHPEVIARTFREVTTLAKDGPGADELARLDESMRTAQTGGAGNPVTIDARRSGKRVRTTRT